MAEKMKSLITKISLRDAATFHNVTLDELTYVNFFFGKNGAGKSTLASSISDPKCQEWDPQVNPANYTILTYNQDFINTELPDYGNLKGVFTLSKENAEIRQQIDDATAQREIVITDGKNAGAARDSKNKELEPLLDHFQGECWDPDSLKAFRKRFDKALTGYKRKQLLADRILTNDYSLAHHEDDDIQKVYDIAYDPNARAITYPSFKESSELGGEYDLSGEHYLGEKVTSSSDTEFAGFMRQICRFDREEFIRTALEGAKKKDKEEGRESEHNSNFHMAQSLLKYIDRSGAYNDDLNFTEDSIDCDSYRHALEMIVEVMNQSQHYTRMMEEAD